MSSSQSHASLMEQSAAGSGWKEVVKPVLLYLVLVGIPVLGILGLLQVGQTLSAPISLAGTWSAHLDAPNGNSIAGNHLLHAGPTVLNISQSGPQVTLAFNDDQKTTLVGNVRAMDINAVGSGQDGATGKSATTSIYLTAKLERQTEPARLAGIVIFDDGSLRTEVPLIAIRQNEVRKATGGH